MNNIYCIFLKKILFLHKNFTQNILMYKGCNSIISTTIEGGITNEEKAYCSRNSFKYSSNDISYLEGKYDDGLKAGMDIKNDAYEKERLDAYTITTSLPNPKTDIESDDLDGYNEEADVVALDIPSATNYKMAVYWMDERDGKNSGEFVVNAELSEKGFIDYNTVDYKTCVSYYYGADKGEIPG